MHALHGRRRSERVRLAGSGRRPANVDAADRPGVVKGIEEDDGAAGFRAAIVRVAHAHARNVHDTAVIDHHATIRTRGRRLPR